MSELSKVTKQSSQLVEDFAGYTTLHGFHFVITRVYAPVRRLIWLCLILTCVGALVKQLVSSFEKLHAHIHVVDQIIVPSDKLTFPAFTLCNINMMKRSKISGTDAQLYLDKLDPFKADKVKHKTLNSSFNLKEAVLKYGHTAKDMIAFCNWKGKPCSYKNFTTTFLSQNFGLCHTFNLGDNVEQLVSSTSNQKDLGLTLLLDIDNEEYYGFESYQSTGVKVVVHHQTEIPWVENAGNDIMPGFTTSIKITRKQVKRLPPPFRSACGSKKLVTSNVYTQRRCMIECFTRAMIKSRGCKILGMPNLPGFHHVGYCNPSEIRNDSSADELAKVRPNNCGCPIACKEITYTTVQSLAYFPSRSFMEMYANETRALKLRFSEFRARFMMVVAYFEELNTEVSIEKPFYDINDFGSDVGGNLGLFLGCSVLTIMEFLDLLIMYCCQKLRSRNRTEQSNTDVEAG